MIWLILILLVAAAVLIDTQTNKEAALSRRLKKNFAPKATTFFKDWPGKFNFGHGDKEISSQFMKWAIGNNFARKTSFYKGLPETASDFTDWLKELSDQDLRAYVQELSKYCEALDFKLAWLFDENVDRELRAAVEEAILLYSLGTTKSRDIRALTAFKTWQDTPDQKKDPKVTQKLYATLVEADLAQPPPELFLASEKERLRHMIESIRQTALHQSKVFNKLLKVVYSDTTPVSMPEENGSLKTLQPEPVKQGLPTQPGQPGEIKV